MKPKAKTLFSPQINSELRFSLLFGIFFFEFFCKVTKITDAQKIILTVSQI